MRMTDRRASRMAAGMAALSLLAPLFGCAPTENRPINAAPPDAPYGRVPPPQQQSRQGMSTGKKLAILAGAAALIYMYNKHKNARGAGPQGQYYRSRNGRVYYRDAQGNAVWVTPPREGITVPENEAQVYRRAAERGDWNVDMPASGYTPAGRSRY